LDPLDVDEDPLKWWIQRKSKLPILTSLAFKLLSIPATSAPSERLLSTIAAKILVKERARLDPGLLSGLIFLKENGLGTKKHFGESPILPYVYEDPDDAEELLREIAELIRTLEADIFIYIINIKTL
jgi:hypothetical protein